MAIQLLRALTNVTVIATASQPVTKAWCANLGAHHVLDHSQALSPQVAELGIGDPGYVFSTARSGERQADILELLAPQGRFGYVDCPEELHVQAFQAKCISLYPEDPFMRSWLQTIDVAEQGEILRQIGELVDAGKIRTTLTSILGAINAANLPQAHRLIESGTAVGKFGLEGFTAQP
ncbi:zinc-binding dehydrogenase [Leucobacter soli]|uniref:Zinc-type alcohol dehydrogenase-like protein n=1 Tax=Leucobacter soli TaxID=2812850 RepID=A0A916JZP9_9MICO|nr:zinc-binding dehydrogenase [Leucobacter soli]CAG7618958.1 Zinc-type alcohol dehydrogenase-like protein [Leucobacter soli]